MLRTQRYLKDRNIWIVGAMLSSLLLMILLAACGTTTSGSGQPGPTATTPAQVQKCGTLHNRLNGLPPADKAIAAQVEQCFYQAYKQCQPATLIFEQNGLDAGTINNFSLKNVNGTCTVTDGFQHYVAPRPPSAPMLFTCASMDMQADGLHIHACGDANTVWIPLS